MTTTTSIDTWNGKTKTVKMNKRNFWLLELIYGDAASDRTAKFQIPCNIYFKK